MGDARKKLHINIRNFLYKTREFRSPRKQRELANGPLGVTTGNEKRKSPIMHTASQEL
jgi:hypothetical protein